MSLGSILGGIAGGVIGFFVGGPGGAVYGASIGFGIGMAIDPITPDIPSPGIPDPEQQVMSGEIGGPIPDLCGTGKVPGHLLFFGKERSIYIEPAQPGGKGGSPVEAAAEAAFYGPGYSYWMSWGVGIVQCPDNPVDVLYAIYKNDDVEAVWPGTDVDPDTWEGLSLPVSGGQETIIIDGIGSMIFSFGTDDQMPIAAVGEVITDSTLNTPYRYLCWAFFDDCYIGKYNRTPTYRFILKKIPQIAAMPDFSQIQEYDCNPAHALYYIFNVLSGLPVSWLNADDFNAVALTLSTEKRGTSVLFDRQQSALNYIENINGHTDNIIRYGSDGQFHPKLIRDDYVLGDLPLIDESVMLDDPSFSRGSWIDTVNELKVQYSEIIDVERPGIFNIYGLFINGAAIWGVLFDGLSLSFVGSYNSGSGDINGLVLFDDDLVTIGGNGATADMRHISSTPVSGLFPLVQDYTPFNQYDLTATGGVTLINGTNSEIYCIDSIGKEIRIDNFVKQERAFYGSVVLGTDGNLYRNTTLALLGDPTWGTEPIIGALWNVWWTVIPDNINDGPTVAWGVGTASITGNASKQVKSGNSLFLAKYQSPRSFITEIEVGSYDILQEADSGFCYSLIDFGDYIFGVCGVPIGAASIRRYSKIDLSDQIAYSLDGVVGTAGDIGVSSAHIIVATSTDLYKFNEDLTLADSVTLGVACQKLTVLDDEFVAIGDNNGVSVYNLNTMALVDRLVLSAGIGTTQQAMVSRAI